VEFNRPSGIVVAETEDLSPSGMFIRTEALLPAGEETDVWVTLPDESIIMLRARVAHLLTPVAARALGRHPGMGFELLGDDDKLRAHIDAIRGEITSPNLISTTELIVAEPSLPLRTRMARCLETAGFGVTAVASATDALEACTVWRPDGIVAAAAMPGMTGIDLAYATSEHSTLSDVPLILTGEDGDLGRLEAFRAGIRDYIPVPFLDEELVIRVHRVVAPVQPTVSPGVRGTLGDISLGTLLSLFEFERKSGILMIIRGMEVSRVLIAEGKILKVEASVGNGAPRERLMKLLDLAEGQFEFSPSTIAAVDEIGASVTQLLLEHARMRDEQDEKNAR
jgi:CheY-like chemotaxis protein/Tfp pilus assembly protein PilZ